MNELKVEIGGSTRGFENATKETQRMARDLQRDLDKSGGAHTPQSWGAISSLSQKSRDLIGGVGGSGGGIGSLPGLFGESGNAVMGMAAKFGSAAGVIGIFTGAIAGAYSGMNAAFNLQREASNLGVGASFLKGFGIAADDQGMDPGDATGKLYRVTNKIGEAAGGDKAAKKMFSDMGVQIGGKNMEQVLLQIAKAFDGIKDPAERAAKATDLFGRGGQTMLPVLHQLIEDARSAPRDTFRNLFTVDDQQTAVMAKAYRGIKEAGESVWRTLKGGFNNVVASGLQAVGVQADAPEITRISEKESPEDIKARQTDARAVEKEAAAKTKEHARLQRELREEMERTAPIATRIKMLAQDANHLDNVRYAAQMAGDENGRLAAQIEFLKKKKELEDAREQAKKLDKPAELAAKQMSHIDSLSGMGLMTSVGAMTNPVLDVSRKQLAMLTDIRDAVVKSRVDIFAP